MATNNPRDTVMVFPNAELAAKVEGDLREMYEAHLDYFLSEEGREAADESLEDGEMPPASPPMHRFAEKYGFVWDKHDDESSIFVEQMLAGSDDREEIDQLDLLRFDNTVLFFINCLSGAQRPLKKLAMRTSASLLDPMTVRVVAHPKNAEAAAALVERVTVAIQAMRQEEDDLEVYDSAGQPLKGRASYDSPLERFSICLELELTGGKRSFGFSTTLGGHARKIELFLALSELSDVALRVGGDPLTIDPSDVEDDAELEDEDDDDGDGDGDGPNQGDADDITCLKQELAALPKAASFTNGKGLSENAITAFEETLGSKIPEELRQFLTTFGFLRLTAMNDDGQTKVRTVIGERADVDGRSVDLPEMTAKYRSGVESILDALRPAKKTKALKKLGGNFVPLIPIIVDDGMVLSGCVAISEKGLLFSLDDDAFSATGQYFWAHVRWSVQNFAAFAKVDVADLDALVSRHRAWLAQVSDEKHEWLIFDRGDGTRAIHPESTRFGHANFAQKKLRHLLFAGRDLRAASFLGAKFQNVDFSHAKLAHAMFIESRGEKARFVGADLSHADFSRAILRGASFKNADCTETDFEGADLTGCDFSGATLSGVKTKGAIQPPSA